MTDIIGKSLEYGIQRAIEEGFINDDTDVVIEECLAGPTIAHGKWYDDNMLKLYKDYTVKIWLGCTYENGDTKIVFDV